MSGFLGSLAVLSDLGRAKAKPPRLKRRIMRATADWPPGVSAISEEEFKNAAYICPDGGEKRKGRLIDDSGKVQSYFCVSPGASLPDAKPPKAVKPPKEPKSRKNNQPKGWNAEFLTTLPKLDKKLKEREQGTTAWIGYLTKRIATILLQPEFKVNMDENTGRDDMTYDQIDEYNYARKWWNSLSESLLESVAAGGLSRAEFAPGPVFDPMDSILGASIAKLRPIATKMKQIGGELTSIQYDEQPGSGGGWLDKGDVYNRIVKARNFINDTAALIGIKKKLPHPEDNKKERAILDALRSNPEGMRKLLDYLAKEIAPPVAESRGVSGLGEMSSSTKTLLLAGGVALALWWLARRK